MTSIFGSSRIRRAGGIALAFLLTAARAQAQVASTPSSVASSDARAHFERGVTFYNESDFSAALVEFKRAYALAPAWQVLFNIGQSYFQLRNYADALVTLTHFLDEGQDRVPEARRAVVDAERADLANRVGHAKIACNRAGATIAIDSVEVGVTPLSEPLLVSVGVRKVTAALPGGLPLEQEVSIPAGETVDVHLDFPEMPPPATPAAAPPPAVIVPPVTIPHAPLPSSSTNHGAAIAAYGIAVAGAAVGAVFGVLTLRDKSRLEGECNGKACDPGSQADIDAVGRDGTLSTIAFGVTAAAAVVGTVLWVTSGSARPRETSSVPVRPSVRFGAGFVGGSF
jgi:hypothetical protein